MLPAKTADIVIIGGGVMGTSAAYHLAQRGIKNVMLLEREQFFGTGATGRCAGGVRYQFGTEINVRLSIESLGMLERFKQEIGQDINYRKCGYLFVLTDERHVQVFRAQRRDAGAPGRADPVAFRRRGPPPPAAHVLPGCPGRHIPSRRWSG